MESLRDISNGSVFEAQKWIFLKNKENPLKVRNYLIRIKLSSEVNDLKTKTHIN